MIWLSFLAGLGAGICLVVLAVILAPERNRKEFEQRQDAFNQQLIGYWRRSEDIGEDKIEQLQSIANCLNDYLIYQGVYPMRDNREIVEPD